MKLYCVLLAGISWFLNGCRTCDKPLQPPTSPAVVVLGVAQDAGYPQMGCTKECCKRVLNDPSLKRFITSLAVVDPANKKWWLFEATPDIKEQLQLFKELTDSAYNFLPDGIFLTHGHIGHYTGLMELGREVMSTKAIPVYAMPRMKKYLTENGPWSQLVSLNNISLVDLKEDSIIALNSNISITPFLVPHRDEYTETVGFTIKTNSHQAVFIPDIDKWNKFNRNIDSMITKSNYTLIDGTFYADGELAGRSMSEVPHPFISESSQQFDKLPEKDKMKINFIHFNHTNPLLNENSKELNDVMSNGFRVARQGQLFHLK